MGIFGQELFGRFCPVNDELSCPGGVHWLKTDLIGTTADKNSTILIAWLRWA